MRRFRIADWDVDPDRNLISRDDERRRLEPKVMNLLVYLAERAGEVLSRDQIYRDVWTGALTGDAALQTAISAIRKAFGDKPSPAAHHRDGTEARLSTGRRQHRALSGPRGAASPKCVRGSR